MRMSESPFGRTQTLKSDGGIADPKEQGSAQNPSFHNAAASAKAMKNPNQGHQLASAQSAYHLRCASCHGGNGQGMGNVPALANGPAQSASDGELFWYITKGEVKNGMPSWEILPLQ